MTFLLSNYVGLKKPWPSGAQKQNKTLNNKLKHHDLIVDVLKNFNTNFRKIKKNNLKYFLFYTHFEFALIKSIFKK